jgi:hypothetical protein
VADGSIIATIIAAHIINMQMNSAPLQGRNIGAAAILVPDGIIRVPMMSAPAICALVDSRTT